MGTKWLGAVIPETFDADVHAAVHAAVHAGSTATPAPPQQFLERVATDFVEQFLMRVPRWTLHGPLELPTQETLVLNGDGGRPIPSDLKGAVLAFRESMQGAVIDEMEMQLIPETELESFETHTRHPQQDMVYWHAFVHALYSRSAEEPPVNEWVLRETGVAVKGPLMLLKLKSRRESAYVIEKCEVASLTAETVAASAKRLKGFGAVAQKHLATLVARTERAMREGPRGDLPHHGRRHAHVVASAPATNTC